MIEPRFIKCLICKKREQEPEYGDGFPEWMGMEINKVGEDGKEERAHLCPECKVPVLAFIDGLIKSPRLKEFVPMLIGKMAGQFKKPGGNENDLD